MIQGAGYSLRPLETLPIILHSTVDDVCKEVWSLVPAHADLEEFVCACIELFI